METETSFVGTHAVPDASFYNPAAYNGGAKKIWCDFTDMLASKQSAPVLASYWLDFVVPSLKYMDNHREFRNSRDLDFLVDINRLFRGCFGKGITNLQAVPQLVSSLLGRYSPSTFDKGTKNKNSVHPLKKQLLERSREDKKSSFRKVISESTVPFPKQAEPPVLKVETLGDSGVPPLRLFNREISEITPLVKDTSAGDSPFHQLIEARESLTREEWLLVLSKPATWVSAVPGVPEELVEFHQASMWDVIHKQVKPPSSSDSDFVRHFQARHQKIPSFFSKQKQEALRQHLARCRYQAKNKVGVSICVNSAYDLSCSLNSAKVHPRVLLDLEHKSEIFTYVKGSGLASRRPFTVGEAGESRPIGINGESFASGAMLASRVVSRFNNTRDQRWMATLCYGMDLPDLSWNDKRELSRVVQDSVNLLKTSKGRVVSSFQSNLSTWVLCTDAIVRPPSSGRWREPFTEFDRILLGKVVPGLQLKAYTPGTLVPVAQVPPPRPFPPVQQYRDNWTNHYAKVVRNPSVLSEDLKEVKLQGRVSEGIDFIGEITSALKGVSSIPFGERLLKVVAHLGLLSATKSMRAWVSHLLLLVLDVGAYPFLQAAFDVLLESCRSVDFSFQGEESSVAQKIFVEPANRFMETTVGRSLWDVLSMFSVLSLFQATGWFGSEEEVRKYVSRFTVFLRFDKSNSLSTTETFITRVMNLFKVVVEKFTESIQAGDLTLLFRDDMSLERWVFIVNTLCDNESIRLDPGRPQMKHLFTAQRETGMIPALITKQLDVKERVDMLLVMKDFKRSMESRYSADPLLRPLIRNTALKINGEILGLQSMLANSSYRVQPWGLFLYGSPGVGKTTLVSKIHRYIAEIESLIGDETTMYRLDTKTNFHDAFYEQMWACFFDDVDQSMAAESGTVLNHAEQVNRIINTAPYCMEKAALEDKGKYFANFLTAYYCTNFEDGKLNGKTDCTLQFWRRFPVKVHMVIKPDFSDGAGGISKLKAYLPDGVTIRPNIWNYTVNVYDPSTANLANQYASLPISKSYEFDDDASFLFNLGENYKRWMARQRATIAARNSPVHLPVCPLCNLPLIDHSSGLACESPRVYALQGVDTVVNLLIFMSLAHWIQTLFRSGKSFYASLSSDWKEAITVAFLRYLLGFTGSSLLLVHVGTKEFGRKIISYAERDVVRKVFERVYGNKEKVLAACVVALGMVALAKRYFSSEEFVSSLQGDAPAKSTGFPKTTNIWDFATVKSYDRLFEARTKPSYTLNEMLGVLQRRIYRVRCLHTGKSMHAVALSNGIVVMPRHLITSDYITSEKYTIPEGLTLEFLVGPGVVRVILDPRLTTAIPNRDILVTSVPELPVFKDKAWDMLREFPNACLASSGSQCDEAWLVRPGGSTPYTGNRLAGVRGYPVDTERVEFHWRGVGVDTEDGDCGSPMVARFGDKFYIVGFHTAAGSHKGMNVAIGESFSSLELKQAFFKIQQHQPNSLEIVTDPQMINADLDCLQFQSLRTLSSLNVSLKAKPIPCIVFGTFSGDRPKFGGKMKTNVVQTSFRRTPSMCALLSSVIPEGEEFEPPQFGGRMVASSWNGEETVRWMDPHCRSNESYRNVGGESIYWESAVRDYLSGLGNLSGATGYVPLSDYATAIGIEQTGAGPLDLTTSAGPPFFATKKSCVSFDRTKSPPTVKFHKDLTDGMARILEVLDRGDVYSPPAVHTLKDEVVTRKKNANFKVRVFNVMPLAYNFLLKKFISPIVDFFRQHPYWFEHSIGLNIASLRDSTRMRSFLKKYPNVCASDVSDFDVSASTRELHYSCLVVQRLAHHLGYTPTEKKRVWGLLMSSFRVTHVCKGDFWLTNYGLASGCWVTLFLNCIRNSLQSRYAYFSLGRHLVLPSFREVVNQLVLGDDNISCVHPSFDWFNQITVADSLRGIGAVRTSSIKGKDLVEYEAFPEATFLKRVFREIDGLCVCPIDKKTIVRMLSHRQRPRAGVMSDVDHHSIILSTVMAESWMWGEEFYNLMRVIVDELVLDEALNLSSNPNLRLYSFQEYLSKYADGTLITWAPLLSVQEQQEKWQMW